MGSSDALSLLPWILIVSSFFLILASLLRISFMIQFISRTVITAYVTAASCLIIANQCKHLLGLRNDAGEIPTSFFEIILRTFSSIQFFSLSTLSLSLITAILFLLLQSKFPSLPNVAITLILSSIIAIGLETLGWEITKLESFDSAASLLTFPEYSLFLTHWESILSAAFAVSLLCLLEGLSIGKSLAARAGSRIESNPRNYVYRFRQSWMCYFLRHACIRIIDPLNSKCSVRGTHQCSQSSCRRLNHSGFDVLRKFNRIRTALLVGYACCIYWCFSN